MHSCEILKKEPKVSITCIYASIHIYRSLAKERPWVEYITSLPKRGVGALLSVSAFNRFSTKTCIVNCMHGSNHIGFSVWQWNRGLHESLGCPKLGYTYTFSKPKLSGLRSNHLAWATTLEGFEKSAHFARPLCLSNHVLEYH